MEFKGTKGKWEFEGELTNETTPSLIICGEKTIVRMVAYEFFGCTIEEANANAKLIACAPELLDALRGLMSDIGGGKKQCGHDFDCRCAWDKANELIKRATE